MKGLFWVIGSFLGLFGVYLLFRIIGAALFRSYYEIKKEFGKEEGNEKR